MQEIKKPDTGMSSKEGLYMDIVTQFNNVYQRMDELHITQKELAELMDMSPASFSHRMTGRIAWTLPEMLMLLDLIGQPEETLDDFFGRAA